jgi:hypothetical protein
MIDTVAHQVRSAPSARFSVQPARRVLLTFASLLLIAAATASISMISGPSQGNDGPKILLFVGKGTSPGDVAALKQILNRNHFDFSTADSNQLNELSESQFATYQLLIVPGGNFENIGKGVTATTTANIRKAVRGGLSYLGICAGAFFAGNAPYNGLNLTGGVRFKFYALEHRNIRKAAVPIDVAGSGTFDHYWEDGPELTGWGDAVAKYPDGTPAIVQGTAGDGWVVLSGVHPEAPDSWRKGLIFSTPAQLDNAYAASLIWAALNRMPLAHY